MGWAVRASAHTLVKIPDQRPPASLSLKSREGGPPLIVACPSASRSRRQRWAERRCPLCSHRRASPPPWRTASAAFCPPTAWNAQRHVSSCLDGARSQRQRRSIGAAEGSRLEVAKEHLGLDHLVVLPLLVRLERVRVGLPLRRPEEAVLRHRAALGVRRRLPTGARLPLLRAGEARRHLQGGQLVPPVPRPLCAAPPRGQPAASFWTRAAAAQGSATAEVQRHTAGGAVAGSSAAARRSGGRPAGRAHLICC